MRGSGSNRGPSRFHQSRHACPVFSRPASVAKCERNALVGKAFQQTLGDNGDGLNMEHGRAVEKFSQENLDVLEYQPDATPISCC